MKKYSFLIFASLLVIFASCEKQATSESATADSAKVDSLKIKDSTTAAEVVAAPSLSGKAAVIAKNWKASEFETPTVKLPGDLIDIRFDFLADGSFKYSEDGKKQSGKWSVNEQGTSLTLEYDDKRNVTHSIKELSDEKMIIAGKEHGMYRTITLVPRK